MPMRGHGDGPIKQAYMDDTLTSPATRVSKAVSRKGNTGGFECDYDFVKANEQFASALSHLSEDLSDVKLTGLFSFLFG